MSDTTWRINGYNLRASQITHPSSYHQTSYTNSISLLIMHTDSCRKLHVKHEFFVKISHNMNLPLSNSGPVRTEQRSYPAPPLKSLEFEKPWNKSICDLPAVKSTSLKLVNSIRIFRIKFQMRIPEVSKAEYSQLDYYKKESSILRNGVRQPYIGIRAVKPIRI